MSAENTKISLILKGAAMGIAEVIPGVSGGTIAFITGIYEKLIDTIKAIGPEAIYGYKEGGLKGLWTTVNGDFLLWLLIGMAGGLVSGIFGVTYLMEHYPQPLWAFFFGLILASAIYMSKQLDKWTVGRIIALLLGAIFAYGVTSISPAEGSLNYGYVFLSGMIAISALMLPGISGSFILLIMGMYTLIVPLVKDMLHNFSTSNLLILVVFGFGCLTGMATFSRFLSWLFKQYKQMTFAVLTGFLIGALNKVWPWREVSSYLNKETGKIVAVKDQVELLALKEDAIKVLSEINVAPHNFILPSILAFVFGFGLVFILERFDQK